MNKLATTTLMTSTLLPGSCQGFNKYLENIHQKEYKSGG